MKMSIDRMKIRILSTLRCDSTDEIQLGAQDIVFRCILCGRVLPPVATVRRYSRAQTLLTEPSALVQQMLDSIAPNCDCDRPRCRIAPKVQRKYRMQFGRRNSRMDDVTLRT